MVSKLEDRSRRLDAAKAERVMSEEVVGGRGWTVKVQVPILVAIRGNDVITRHIYCKEST